MLRLEVTKQCTVYHSVSIDKESQNMDIVLPGIPLDGFCVISKYLSSSMRDVNSVFMSLTTMFPFPRKSCPAALLVSVESAPMPLTTESKFALVPSPGSLL